MADDVETTLYHPASRVQVKNTGEHDCPGYGILRIVDDSDYVAGKTYLKVDRPDDTYRQTYLICGKQPIEAGKTGVAYFATQSPVWALWASDSTAPSLGDFFLPVPDAFTLTNGGFGFRVVGKSETTPFRRVLVLQIPPESIVGTVDEDLLSMSSATVSVRKFGAGGPYPDSGMKVTGYGDFIPGAKKFAADAEGSNLLKLTLLGGKWVVDTSRSCPVDA